MQQYAKKTTLENVIYYTKSFLSIINSFLPSILAVINIVYISNMCTSITGQNKLILELLLTPKEKESVTKIAETVVENVSSVPQVGTDIDYTPFFLFISSLLLCCLFIYFNSNGNDNGSTSPTPPNSTSADPKIIEDLIAKEVKEKAEEITLKIADTSSASNQLIHTSFESVENGINNISLKIDVNNNDICNNYKEIKVSLSEMQQYRSQIDADINTAITLTQTEVDGAIRGINDNFEAIEGLLKDSVRVNATHLVGMKKALTALHNEGLGNQALATIQFEELKQVLTEILRVLTGTS